MAWLYLRRSEDTGDWYAGRTHHENYHHRNSGSKGPFAVGMDGKELAVKVDDNEAHWNESEAIQALIGIVGRQHVANIQQTEQPVTGWMWDTED